MSQKPYRLGCECKDTGRVDEFLCLACTSDDEENKIAKTIFAQLDDKFLAAISGPVIKQRMTALRVHGMAFETVEIDDNGLVIEPVRCTCRWAVIVNFDCPLHKEGINA